MDVTSVLLEKKIVAIFRGITDQQADAAAHALVDGGISLMEVTMNTDGALPIISRWREQWDGIAYIGAGTVLNVSMAQEAIAAGAQFLISPNLDEDVIAYGAERGIDVWPGVMTPTEIVRAWSAGAKLVKLFPMGFLGLSYLREVRAPLNHIPMMATGGVDLNNIADTFSAGASAVGLGTKLVRPDLLARGDYAQMTANARAYVEAVAGDFVTKG
ncbi:2-dehydro-3-deoxyphosphogluconate aldolase [Paenibacillus selenitireducens]|uniref:2-dehydro-3-deoxyphosphogluconate aldolase n=1 Tax=Paenibacillus selenitireducens TaxID=1324314 RepID=A0A1T2X1Y1_9BACL|nr:bifunctional 4-hydroxy-2-oxoglutarate aldolase/2-dehydro-3-deoxy-phosphogluconate aldolase [Paenibacillus selenitireducens]OPA73872.1 2-dehydro-3-deoxyphosphogluconate aldolase [Paenibacillus selenitireducens]